MYTSNAKILQAVSNRWSDLDKRMSVPFMYIPRHGKRRTRFLTVVVLGSAPPFPFLMSEVLFQENERVLYSFPGPVFVNVYGAQSIPPGWESIPGLLKRLTNTDSVPVFLNF
jgi:hypothetical protein